MNWLQLASAIASGVLAGMWCTIATLRLIEFLEAWRMRRP